MSFCNSEEPTKLLMSGVLNHFSCVWFFATLWTVAHQAPLSMGFSRPEYWSWSPCPPSGDLPNLGIKPLSLMFPAVSLPLAPPGKTHASLCPWKKVCDTKRHSLNTIWNRRTGLSSRQSTRRLTDGCLSELLQQQMGVVFLESLLLYFSSPPLPWILLLSP